MNIIEMNRLIQPIGHPRSAVADVPEFQIQIIDTSMGVAEVLTDFAVQRLTQPVDFLDRRQITFRLDDETCRVVRHDRRGTLVCACAGGVVTANGATLPPDGRRREVIITCDDAGTFEDIAGVIKPGDAIALFFTVADDRSCRPIQRIGMAIGIIRDGGASAALPVHAAPENRSVHAARPGTRNVD